MEDGLKGYCSCRGAPVFWNNAVIHDEEDGCIFEGRKFDNYRDEEDE